MDWTSFRTRCIEAVQKRNFFCALSVRNRLNVLHVMPISNSICCQLLQCIHIDSFPFLRADSFHLIRYLGKSLIAACLQKGGSHGYRPDTASHNFVNIVIICTSGIGNSKLSCEFSRKFGCKGNGQREQSFAGHVHFFTWKLISGNINRESIGNLYTKFQTQFFG